MKKNIKISALVAVIITTVWTAVNLISIYCFDKVLFAVKSFGGEITTYKGIGFSMDKIYPVAPVGKDNTVTNIHIDYVSLGILLIISFAVALLVSTLISKRKSK